MRNTSQNKRLSGLYVLGSLYPHVTGGMEIFNYYFLNNRLENAADEIYYLGQEKTDSKNGNFVPLKKLWPTRLFYPVQFFFAVSRLRKQLDYVYICYAEQSWIIPYSQSVILRFFKIPYIVTNHWGKEPDWKFKYPYVYYFRHAHAVIGVSEPICSAFKKVIPDQDFQYIPPLIPFQRALKSKPESKAQLGYDDQEKILLFVGSLKGMKNPDKIVEAFRIIGSPWLHDHNMRLVLVGKGEMENELRRKIEQGGLDKYVRMPGLVSRELIPDYYNAADVYIISSDYEGTSLSLLEAMFNRLAIIASDAPGINRMLTHEYNALLYDTVSAGQLAGTIKRIFSDPELANRLSEMAAAEFNRQFSYESMIEKYMAIFSSV
jgi:glycosyltransferase involved in cell wall biosynthesis